MVSLLSKPGAILLVLLGLITFSALYCDRAKSTVSSLSEDVGGITLDVVVPDLARQNRAVVKAAVTHGHVRISGEGMVPIDTLLTVQDGRIQARLDGIPVGLRTVSLALQTSSDDTFVTLWEASTEVTIRRGEFARATLALQWVGGYFYFENGRTDWEPWERGPDGGSMVGEVCDTVLVDGDSNVLEVKRTGSETKGAAHGVRQDLIWDVSGATSLLIKVDVKVVHQSLRGGGNNGEEFPARIIIAYEDADGNAHSWQHGFYSLDTAANDTAANATIPVTKVDQNVWHSYTEDPMLLENKPHTITQITLWGNGHDYTSRFDKVILRASSIENH